MRTRLPKRLTIMATKKFNHSDTDQIRVTITLSKEIFELLEKLKVEYGVSTRGRVIEMLLQDLLSPEG